MNQQVPKKVTMQGAGKGGLPYVVESQSVETGETILAKLSQPHPKRSALFVAIYAGLLFLGGGFYWLCYIAYGEFSLFLIPLMLAFLVWQLSIGLVEDIGEHRFEIATEALGVSHTAVSQNKVLPFSWKYKEPLNRHIRTIYVKNFPIGIVHNDIVVAKDQGNYQVNQYLVSVGKGYAIRQVAKLVREPAVPRPSQGETSFWSIFRRRQQGTRSKRSLNLP